MMTTSIKVLILAFLCLVLTSNAQIFSSSSSSTFTSITCDYIPLPTDGLYTTNAACDTGSARDLAHCEIVCEDFLNVEEVVYSLTCDAGVWVNATNDVFIPADVCITILPSSSSSSSVVDVTEKLVVTITLSEAVNTAAERQLVREFTYAAYAAYAPAGINIEDYILIQFIDADGNVVTASVTTMQVIFLGDAMYDSSILSSSSSIIGVSSQELMTTFLTAWSDPSGDFQLSGIYDTEASFTAAVGVQCWDGSFSNPCPNVPILEDNGSNFETDVLWGVVIGIFIACTVSFCVYGYYKHSSRSDKFDDIEVDASTYEAPGLGAVPVPNFAQGGQEDMFEDDEQEMVHITIG